MIAQSEYVHASATYSPCAQPVAVAVIGKCFSSSQGLLKGISDDANLRCTGFWRNGIDAFESLEESPPQVVLMDIDFPEVHGLVATSRIKVRFPLIQILAVTSSYDSNTILAAIKAGASGYVLKSATPADVARAIQTVCNGGAAVSAEVAQGLVTDFHNLLRNQMSPSEITRRERHVLQCICRGLSNKEIADELDITVWTVAVHLKSIYRKFSVHSRTEAAMKYRDSLSQPRCLS
ncbi:response regulator transcription factor [Luteolibacter soli]|uniref:Response regulator transcription factor n=1 Tax=Luteolibacter soli TaxID=3135280 RepID=A0ABU9APT4_9BACT